MTKITLLIHKNLSPMHSNLQHEEYGPKDLIINIKHITFIQKKIQNS
jgi:hypothetical protein